LSESEPSSSPSENPYSEVLGRRWTDAEMAQSDARITKVSNDGSKFDMFYVGVGGGQIDKQVQMELAHKSLKVLALKYLENLPEWTEDKWL